MEVKIFKEFLGKKGLKFTKERKAILKEVFSHHGHFDIDALLIKMRKKNVKVSTASIYRTFPLLIECGLVEQVEKIDKRARYEHTFGHGHHDHLICIKCGKITDVYSEKLEKIQKNLCKKERFLCLTHSLELKGYCSKCQTKGKT